MDYGELSPHMTTSDIESVSLPIPLQHLSPFFQSTFSHSHILILLFSHSHVQGPTSGIESETASSDIHEGTLSDDRSPTSTITSSPAGSSSGGGSRERGGRGGKEGGRARGGGVARPDSGVGSDEWVSVQRKKKPAGEGRVSRTDTIHTV